MSMIRSPTFQLNTGTTKDSITFLHTIKVLMSILYQDHRNKNDSFASLTHMYHVLLSSIIKFLDFEFKRPNLKFVKIQFSAPVFDRVTKDRAAKFVDQLSAIGGTMGLLTGFSIISGVEIVYFAIKTALKFIKTNCTKF